MNSSFSFKQVSGYKCLVHNDLFERHIKHGYVSNQLNLKETDLAIPVDLSGIGHVSLAKQTHGTTVLRAIDYGLEGDAFIVKATEACGVRTADCVPLILVNEKNLEVGCVIHAGWQGACAGIVENTLNELFKLGYDIEDFVALIGPSAMSCCYEVQEDVASLFSSGISKRGARTYLSVPEYISNILSGQGMPLEKIYCANICTLCSPDFFSYRKTGATAGRFLSFLSL